MPTIGSPPTNNPFNRVQMGAPAGAIEKDKNVGDKLNEMAGNGTSSGNVKFVDGKNHNKMGKDEFLRLLTVQLANQDPVNPVDQQKMAAELAQFSSLEQLTNMNTKLDGLKENAPSEFKFYGASFLGKMVNTNGSSIDFKGEGQKPSLSFNLPKDAINVNIKIFDEKGQNVAALNYENVTRGDQTITWNGKMMDGTEASKGLYTYKVYGTDQSYGKFEGKTSVTGKVTGVSFENGQTVLKVDGKKQVFLHDVDSFSMPEEMKVSKKLEQDGINAYGEAAR
jgi:flagellar basal-body rod modification protein FlgD